MTKLMTSAVTWRKSAPFVADREWTHITLLSAEGNRITRLVKQLASQQISVTACLPDTALHLLELKLVQMLCHE